AELYEIYENESNTEEPLTEKRYGKMTLSDMGKLIKVYEEVMDSLLPEYISLYVVLGFLKRYKLEYEIYSEYDDEAQEKYKDYLFIDLPS
ncbi:MAG: hypothetical protein ACP5MB_11645, partial [bacterium]